QQRLARDAAVRILRQEGVENAVGNLIGHLVGMAHRDRFACEQIAVVLGHGISSPQPDRMRPVWLASRHGAGPSPGRQVIAGDEFSNRSGKMVGKSRAVSPPGNMRWRRTTNAQARFGRRGGTSRSQSK